MKSVIVLEPTETRTVNLRRKNSSNSGKKNRELIENKALVYLVLQSSTTFFLSLLRLFEHQNLCGLCL